MTLVTLNVIQEWEVDSLLDFLIKFKLQTKAKKYYNVEDLEDVYESDKYLGEIEDMEYWLGTLDGYYRLDYMEEQHCEFYTIEKINKDEVLLK